MAGFGTATERVEETMLGGRFGRECVGSQVTGVCGLSERWRMGTNFNRARRKRAMECRCAKSYSRPRFST